MWIGRGECLIIFYDLHYFCPVFSVPTWSYHDLVLPCVIIITESHLMLGFSEIPWKQICHLGYCTRPPPWFLQILNAVTVKIDPQILWYSSLHQVQLNSLSLDCSFHYDPRLSLCPLSILRFRGAGCCVLESALKSPMWQAREASCEVNMHTRTTGVNMWVNFED